MIGAAVGSSILGFLALFRIVPVAVGVLSGPAVSGDTGSKGPASREVRGVLAFLGLG